MIPQAQPLILTLALDGESFAYFDRLRRLHYPPERNIVPAHLTLFHQLPGDRAALIKRELTAICQGRTALVLEVTGVRSLGRGVAFSIEAPALQALRRELATEWREWLTPQDEQRFQPHITVQNKVGPREAQALHRELAATFRPFTARGEGLQLWRYLNGPWEPLKTFKFARR